MTYKLIFITLTLKVIFENYYFAVIMASFLSYFFLKSFFVIRVRMIVYFIVWYTIISVNNLTQ